MKKSLLVLSLSLVLGLGGCSFPGISARTASPTPTITSTTPTAHAVVHGFRLSGTPNVSRYNESIAVLPSGKVLLAGGGDATNGHILSSAEIYDPQTGKFTMTGSMNLTRASASAVVLQNGKVLIIGGYNDNANNNYGWLASTELYDPETGVFTLSGSMQTPRVSPSAITLNNGNVLVFGGNQDAQEVPGTPLPFLNQLIAELYDPVSRTFKRTGDETEPQFDSEEYLLPDGKVLIMGDVSTNAPYTTNGIEMYDPQSGTFTKKNGKSSIGYLEGFVPLSSDKILISGQTLDRSTQIVEIYDLQADSFRSLGSKLYGTGFLLNNGKVLYIGDYQDAPVLYDLATDTTTSPGVLPNPHVSYTGVLLSQYSVLLLGEDTNSTPIPAVVYY